ncbi:MAG TPA: sigma-70 family RNA polymerase sigma factor [Dehalococcoidia bacterium]|nr:sigma-70 family RNA polymerase sigma factor [Dehalococcoidia bacterium]
MPDDSLLDRARRGDLAAFNALVEEHQAIVYNVCLRMLGSPAAAEDAAQEAFISAWRNLGSLRGDQFRAWLLRIAANACRDELRRRSRRPAASLQAAFEEGMAEPADPEPAPETSLLSAELRGQVQEALLLLPEDQRLAVVLCDLQGLEYDEIARVTGTNIGTVKSRLSRGRARLRALLLAKPELLPEHFRLKSEGRT